MLFKGGESNQYFLAIMADRKNLMCITSFNPHNHQQRSSYFYDIRQTFYVLLCNKTGMWKTCA